MKSRDIKIFQRWPFVVRINGLKSGGDFFWQHTTLVSGESKIWCLEKVKHNLYSRRSGGAFYK